MCVYVCRFTWLNRVIGDVILGDLAFVDHFDAVRLLGLLQAGEVVQSLLSGLFDRVFTSRSTTTLQLNVRMVEWG
jgi:hypothetical protein